jgi:hypothetical protein
MILPPALGSIGCATDDYRVEILDGPTVDEAWAHARMTDRQQHLYRYWSAQADAGRPLMLPDFDPMKIPSCLSYLHLVEYHPAREDFRYRIYGSKTARAAKADMQDHWVSENPGTSGEAFRRHYLDLMANGMPWIGEIRTASGGDDVARHWDRLVLPLSDGRNGSTFGFATLAEPRIRNDAVRTNLCTTEMLSTQSTLRGL